MSSKSVDAPERSGSSSGIFAETLRGTFTTPGEREIWSHFIPLRKLGEGSFGSVVAATRVADNVPVAIKTVLRKRASFVEVEGGVYYPEEVVTLNELCNVKAAIRVLDCIETKDKVIIVMERPEDFIDLATYLRKRQYLDEESSKKIIFQLITCINEFLDLNILHRDLKPANILVNEKTLEIKVIDFGLISDVESSEDILYDRMGTEVYFPPESVHKKRFYAGPGMVWVVGVIAYQILTGSRPFLDDREIKSGPLRIPPRLSIACNSFIKSCLSRNLSSRLSLNSLANHLWLSSDSTVPSTLDPLVLTAEQVGEEESPQFSQLSGFRLPEDERLGEHDICNELKTDESGDIEMSCEEAQLTDSKSIHNESSSISSDSEYEIIQDMTADELMSCEDTKSHEHTTDEQENSMLRDDFSSSISSEISRDNELIQPDKLHEKNFQKNNELTLREVAKTGSVEQMCQFDSSIWEMIPVAIEDLEAAQMLCSMRFNL